MDPEALLDHAVFQLTPTRTRCDLVIFNGGVSEKIASGLVGPFVSHLKYAKDQLPKGGYSIRLSPPANVDASWFTKSTFQRFVRFVSTPEVLERFPGLEKEILQIESSVQSNENAINHEVEGKEGASSTVNGFNKNSPKVKNETEGTDGADGQEENSKIRLQRLMETRKALLRKEQAMAYARALAAGFELENIDDLLYFADAFGASRLREACTAFKDLCKKKHGDGLWMDELAAMQAAYAQLDQPYMVTPGIVLASDGTNGLDQSNDSISSSENINSGAAASDQIQQNSATNANVQMQMPWPNQIPPYMFNFQKQMQNMPPYQAYPFPGMPPYYNMGWPPNMDEHGRNQRTYSKKKKKSPNREADEEDEEEEELTESEPENETDTRRSQSNKKKQPKSSSKTVVIKNINYITSDKRNGEEDGSSDAEDDDSVEDETDEDSLKQVHDIIGSIQKHHQKSNSSKKKKRSGQKGSSRLEVVENNGDSDKMKEVKGNDNWENFQNLLMRDDDPPNMIQNHQSVVQNDFESGKSRSFDLASEKLNTKRNMGMDSLVMSERNEVNEGRGVEDFANGESLRPSMKMRASGDDSMHFTQRGSENFSREGYIPDSSTIKHGKGEDWFVANHSGTSEIDPISGRNMFEGNFTSPSNANAEKGEKVVPIDDSFMVTTRNSVDDHFDSQWKTDISMVSGIVDSSQTETPNKLDTRNSLEPDDLCAVFARDSTIGPVGASWSSEMDYGVEISFVEPNQKPSVPETVVPAQPENGNSPNPKKQTRTKTSPGSLSKTKSDFLSRNRTPIPTRKPITPKSKLEREEEDRKRMEEQLLERQRRIAERTATSGVAKKLPVVGSKVSPNKPGQLKKTSTN